MISNVIAMFSTKNSTRLGIDGDDLAGWSGTAMGAVAHLPRKARTDGPVDRQAHLPDLPLVSDSNRHWGPPTSLSIEFPSFFFSRQENKLKRLSIRFPLEEAGEYSTADVLCPQKPKRSTVLLPELPATHMGW